MNENFYKQIVEESPVGYAYHRIICNQDGIPIDYEFIEVNLAFEIFTGLKASEIIGKKKSEVLPNIKGNEFDWIKFYGDIAINGGKKEFEQCSETLDKCYRVNVYSPEKNYFITHFTDITKEMKDMEEKTTILTESKKSEEELQILTDEYEKVFNGTQDNMFLVKVEGNNLFRYIRNNNAHQKSTGITMEAIRDKTPQELVGESIGNKIALNYNRCVQVAETITYEETLELINGESTWTTSLTPVFHEEQVKYIVGSSLDITEKRRAEVELKKNLERLANIIEGTNVGTWEWNIQTGETVFNERWAGIIGYKLDEIVPDGIRTWRKLAHPDDLRKSDDQLKKVFANQIDYYDVEMRMKHKNGSWVWIHDRGKVTSWDTEGNPLIMNGTHTDINERKLMEESIYIEKEWLRTTLLSIGDAVISTDKQGNIILLNRIAEQYTGWTQKEAFGRPLGEVFNIINDLTRVESENPVHKVLETGSIIEINSNTILISKDNVERSIEDSAAPIKDEDNKINGVVLVFRDITEKKERQKKIEYLSFHDQLTGLYNRRFFEEELKRLNTERNLPITLVMIDVNGLKLTNDAFGHLAGDEVLKKMAGVLKTGSRADDIIARIGGDEFVILLPKTSSKMANIIITRLSEQITKEKVDSINLSISYGWETKKDIVEEMEDIFKRAENHMYRRKLSESTSMRYRTIDVILKVLYEKNEREERHSRRVSHLCAAMGVALGLNHEDINELRTTGLMHDIGKISIDEKILNKPDSLSDSEWLEIKRHPEVGYRILSSVNEYGPLAEYVLAHHERWDGKGYPKGLKGEEIPIEARIIAIADAYDAMRSDRPYRTALTEDIAIEEIKKNAGSQFDPMIVKVFVEKVFRE